ncbi:MAG: PKD domain-containing protein [Phycisphaerae bacterium]
MAGVLFSISQFGLVPSASAEERQFLIMLANSPKQFGDGVQLESQEIIRKQYFDDSDPAIDSFAEFWEEISYGDVTIVGNVTDWIDLPWRVKIDPQVLVTNTGAPTSVGDGIPFFDLNGTGRYEYGFSESFAGSGHQTASGAAVWKPGERFIDIDQDGIWDSRDEVNNMMDFFDINGNPTSDGRPDLRGPWIDLNGDGQLVNAANCVYLSDSDNSSVFELGAAVPFVIDEPDCCPNGPGGTTCNCPPTKWQVPGGDVIDCNGNLIPDVCEVDFPQAIADCVALAIPGVTPCTTLGRTCLQDTSPLDGNFMAAPDGIPDICQFANWNAIPPVGPQPGGCQNCTPLAGPAANPPNRCEFDDSNNNGEIDIVEPWEDFLRRWDPCLTDPDASNRGDPQTHWIKVYDPVSPNAGVPQMCFDPLEVVDYGDPSYIHNNYPARSVYAEELIRQSGNDPEKLLWGSHDPNGPLNPLAVTPFSGSCANWLDTNFTCLCAPDTPGGLRRPCGAAGNSYTQNMCLPENRETLLGLSPADFPCENASNPNCIPNYCFLGYRHQYDPPDGWNDVVPGNVPAGQTFSAKVQVLPDAEPRLRTPKPGTEVADNGELMDRAWYPQFWLERYSASNPPGSTPPAWSENIPQVREFPLTVNNPNRRYFRANKGGRNGDGTGWKAGVCFDVNFETGNVTPPGFTALCDAPILPEERNGIGNLREFFDGWVEYDDLPSSKYHRAGDQRLGEVTSWASNSIFGEDRGRHVLGASPVLDHIIVAAGPLAVDIHGNGSFDAGNQLNVELLTWRNLPPFNDGAAWENELRFDDQFRFHPYAGPSGANLGFRDYNLDGLIDLGESRYAGTENFLADVDISSGNDGFRSVYPWNHSRLIEDCVEVNDRLLDFDDFVDPVALAAVECVNGEKPNTRVPLQYGSDIVQPDGVTSGIVLLPPDVADDGIRRPDRDEPHWVPVHNEDFVPLPDGSNANKSLGTIAGPEKINWNIFFHTLVRSIDSQLPPDISDSDRLRLRYAARAYGHAWQNFPDLYDYDSINNPPLENAPVGLWDLMADGNLVHMIPALKANPCTEWIEPIDLKTVLTPGVDATLTIPPYEAVRDRNTYFLENPVVPGERYYFYSVGQRMDATGVPNGGMPGGGLLIMHTDEGNNPDALPNGQQNATRFDFLIVQADGNGSLESPINAPNFNRGDATDAWPGPADRGDPAHKTRFNVDTVPAATWYTQNAWTGLDVLDIVPDGDGSIQLTLNWQPTDIPSLKFTSPPGGASVNGVFTIAFDATDVHGGTTIELYYTTDPEDITILPNDGTPGSGNFIGSLEKTNPGTRRLSLDWDISGLADETYYIFAKLIPGQGADGVEVDHTEPVPGRNNVGAGTLTINDVDIAGNKARTETWTLRLVNVLPDNTQDWIVNGTLTQPVPSDLALDPYPHLLVNPVTNSGQYVSIHGEVTFTLQSDLSSFALGDSWSFTTTGITATSRSVTILDGEVDEDPRARIFALPLAPDPGETVFFQAHESVDPAGAPLDFTWDFGDGTLGTGVATSHVFQQAGTFTVTLTATNPSGRFGQAQVDIAVTNNSPNAKMTAAPRSGMAPLVVAFSAMESSDTETLPGGLIYQWDFGDGTTANSAGDPGLLFAETEHVYIRDADGVLCERSHLCTFHPRLTVTDEGGKEDADMGITIVVGNTEPHAVVTHAGPLRGGDPHTVTFSAKDSSDADGDVLTVTWIWGDGSPDETYSAVDGKDGLGNVPHTYTRRAGEEFSTFNMTALVSDGASQVESGATVRVSEAFVDSSQPHADFTITPNPPLLGEPFTVDASNSFDRPDRDAPLAKYEWDWGDGSAADTGVTASHTYRNEGMMTVTLVVTDDEDNHGTARKTFSIGGDTGGGNANGIPTARIDIVRPEGGVGFVGDRYVFSGETSSDPDDGDILTYRWTFGVEGMPPQIGIQATPIFEEAGEFLVMLTVTDQLGASDDATVLITVKPRNDPDSPVPIIGTGPRSGAAPLTLTFNGENSYDPNGDPISYRWDFFMGDKIQPEDVPFDSAIGPVVTHLFADAGVFSVVLVVDDGQGAPVASSSEVVTVTARVADTEPEQPVEPGDGETTTPPSRPGLCGFGMLLVLCGSMCGLTIMRVARGRRRGRRGYAA